MNAKITITLKDANVLLTILNQISTEYDEIFGRSLVNARDVIGKKIVNAERRASEED